jgi:signal transduction histidine kinase
MKIRHRIMLWVAGAGLCTSLVFSLVVFWEMRDQNLETMDSQLKTAADTVAEQLGKMRRPWPDDRANMLLISSEHFWIRVYDQDLRPVYSSDLSEAVDLPLLRDRGDDAYMVNTRIPKKDIHFDSDDQDDQNSQDGRNNEDEVTFRTRVIRENVAGSPYLVQVARPMEEMDEEAIYLLSAIGVGLAVSTVLLVGLSYLMAGRIIKPIFVINRLAREINEKTLDKRIPTGRSRDEIYELATRLNQMFDRLQYSFARQKQFLADASHELKSPIAMLRLFFDETIQRNDLPEDFLRQIDNQGRNVLRMDQLVRMLLELSILEIKPSLTLERFNIAELARSVAADFALLAERSNIRMKTEIPERLDMWGDKEKVRRMLINIFDNAVKYNQQDGCIDLTVTEKDDRIHLSLYNTGPGIPHKDLPRVFDQFYRVDKSRSAQYGGAGLGLAIVREIVRLHKGAIFIDSRQGAWTQVDILLPEQGKEDRIA